MQTHYIYFYLGKKQRKEKLNREGNSKHFFQSWERERERKKNYVIVKLLRVSREKFRNAGNVKECSNLRDLRGKVFKKVFTVS